MTEAPRPEGATLGYQSWQNLGFFHWDADPSALRPLVPAELALDTFEGRAYVSVTPFTVVEARPRWPGQLRGLAPYHELNVRTYVRGDDGQPAVWFLSLDVSRWLPAALGRLGRLPFRPARIRRGEEDGLQWFRCVRGLTELSMRWRPGPVLGPPQPGSLEAFLSERYVAFSRAFATSLLRWRLRHPSWRLRSVDDVAIDGGLLQADGLPVDPHARPLAYHADFMRTDMLPVQLAA